MCLEIPRFRWNVDHSFTDIISIQCSTSAIGQLHPCQNQSIHFYYCIRSKNTPFIYSITSSDKWKRKKLSGRNRVPLTYDLWPLIVRQFKFHRKKSQFGWLLSKYIFRFHGLLDWTGNLRRADIQPESRYDKNQTGYPKGNK